MIVVRNENDGWEFRGLKNGQLESRNEKQRLDWAVRGASEIGYFDDHFGIIWDALNGLSACLPHKGFSIPEAKAVVTHIQEQQEEVSPHL